MTFEIGWDFAEVQILKKVRLLQNDTYHRSRLCRAPNSEKVKMALSLKLSGIFDRLLRKHWYYQDLAQEIVKCHFSLVEVLSSSKFWKSENGPTSWTEWNMVMKFCIHIGTCILTRCSPWDCQMTNGIGQGFAEVQILNKVKTLKRVGIFRWSFADSMMLKRSRPRNCKMIFIIGRGFAECQILKKWKWTYLLYWVE